MNIGDLHKSRESAETIEETMERVTRAALLAYPNAEGNPLAAVCLMVSNIQHHTAERNAALSIIANQAGMIAQLSTGILSRVDGGAA